MIPVFLYLIKLEVMSSQEDILRLQDVELANALNAMSSDGSKLNNFITQRKSELYDSVTKEHSDNFQKVYGDLTRASDGTSNILYYHTRNKDLDNVQQAVFDRAKSEADSVQYDSQVAKRQTEINEWTSSNKMDTLFFLQLLLITFTLIVPLIYCNKAGLLPTPVFYGITGMISIAVILTLIVRAQYSVQIRDNRFWNHRRFAPMGAPPTLTCDSIQDGLASIEESATGAFNRVQLAASDAGNKISSAYDSTLNNTGDILSNLTAPAPSNGSGRS
jgi:hypothetical protein